MKYESLIFDIDGTLWDSRSLVAEGYNVQLRAEGMEDRCVTTEFISPLFGKVMTVFADTIFPDLPPEERYPLMERCMATENVYLSQVDADVSYPGIQNAMEVLSKTHRLFIVSNCQCGYPEVTMEKVGIRHLIQDYLCFGDTGAEKHETIRILMERNGITSAAYIGDTQGDRDAAGKAGIDFIWASYGFGVPTDYALKIDKPADLINLPL